MNHPYRTAAFVEAWRGPRWTTWWKRIIVRIAQRFDIALTWRIDRRIARMQKQIEAMRFDLADREREIAMHLVEMRTLRNVLGLVKP